MVSDSERVPPVNTNEGTVKPSEDICPYCGGPSVAARQREVTARRKNRRVERVVGLVGLGLLLLLAWWRG